jgi:hypothetical protein
MITRKTNKCMNNRENRSTCKKIELCDLYISINILSFFEVFRSVILFDCQDKSYSGLMTCLELLLFTFGIFESSTVVS